MWRFVVLLLLGTGGWLRADEATDHLARELVRLTNDPRLSVRERVEATRTLGKLGPKAAVVVPDLIAQLKRLRGTELELLQEAVIDTLGAIGSAAKTALPTLATNVDRSIDLDLAVKRATEQILQASDSRDVSALVQQLSSRDASQRLRAAKALAELKADAVTAVPALTVALSDPDADVRRAVVSAVRQIQPGAKPSKELIQAIMADLDDPDDGMRLLAVRALGRFGNAAAVAIPQVEKLLNDPDRDVRKAAADALVRLSLP